MTVPPSAQATYPGSNGRIVYSLASTRCDGDVLGSVRPDGAGAQEHRRGCPGVARVIREPQFTPDGRRIVFATNAGLGMSTLDGFDAQLLPVPPGEYGWPSPAPDGRSVAFERDGAVWLAGLDGTGLRRLTRGSYPRWAPDGRTLTVMDEIRTAISVVDARSGRRTVRARGRAMHPGADVAPRGGRIVYGRFGDLHVISGNDRRRLTDTEDFDSAPVWSPDGRWIAFVRGHQLSSGFWRAELLIVRSRGGRPRRLLRLPGRFTEVEVTLGWQPRSRDAPATKLPAVGPGSVAPSVEPTCHGRFRTGPVVRPLGEGLGPGLADFTGDGRPDVAMRTDAGTMLRVGDRTGGFDAVQQVLPGLLSTAMSAGDVNGDRIADLIAVDAELPGTGVAVALGDGTGDFSRAPVRRTALGDGAGTHAVGDVDRDGDHDLVLRSGSRLVTLLGDPAGGLAPAPGMAPALSGEALSLALADLDGDARLDVAVGGEERVSIHLGREDGGFDASVSVAVHAGGPVVAGDFDRDGRQELVFPEDDAGARPSIGRVRSVRVTGDGRVSLGAGQDLPAMPSAWASDAFTAADVTGDGVLDLLGAGQRRSLLRVLVGDGSGGFRDEATGPGQRLGRGGYLRVLHPADVDADGRADVVALFTHQRSSPDVVTFFGGSAPTGPATEAISISVAASSLGRGEQAVVSGRPRCSSFEGRLVTLYRRLIRDGAPGAWQPVIVATGRTSGAVRAPDKPSSTAEYQWRFGGDGTLAPAASDVSRIEVSPPRARTR